MLYAVCMEYLNKYKINMLSLSYRIQNTDIGSFQKIYTFIVIFNIIITSCYWGIFPHSFIKKLIKHSTENQFKKENIYSKYHSY